MENIKKLFRGKVKYNTLLLSILSVTTIIRLLLFPENNAWIMNIPAALAVKLFTGTDTLIKDLVFERHILYISHSIFAVMFLLFILSCVLYIMKKPTAYFWISSVQCVLWGLMIGSANFSAVQFFANLTGAVAICTPILAIVVFLVINSLKVKKIMEKERIENE